MFLIQVVVAITLAVISYALMPKTRAQSQSQTATEMENPVATAGAPISVVFGEVLIKSPNILWYGDKAMETFEIKA